LNPHFRKLHLSNLQPFQGIVNGTSQKKQPFQGRHISRMPATTTLATVTATTTTATATATAATTTTRTRTRTRK